MGGEMGESRKDKLKWRIGEDMLSIRPYDDVKSAKYDIEGLSEYMTNLIDFEREKARRTKESADAYYDGYRAAMENIASIMGASNYRANDVEQPSGK